MVRFNNRSRLRVGGGRAWHCYISSRIENIAPTATLAQVFMNERDELASGIVGCGHSQVENYTFGILSTRRVELLNSVAEDKPQRGARGAAGRMRRALFTRPIPPSQLTHSRREWALRRHVSLANFLEQ